MKHTRRTLPIAAATLALASACATAPKPATDEASSAASISRRSPMRRDGDGIPAMSQTAADELRRALEKVESELEGFDYASEDLEAEADAAPAEDGAALAAEFSRGVKRWVRYFAHKDRERFQRFLDRGSAFQDVVQSILDEYGLPPELYYLAMIESGYQTHARSRARAVGVWQFMRATGRHYGLQSTHYVDDRRDPIRATDAAAKYLANLYNAFQSWYLAIAAYNSGEYRVLGAIMRGKTRDYWELVSKRLLPPETRNYVPKFFAAAMIGRNPEKYGFVISEEPQYPSVEAVAVPSPIRLQDAARVAQVPLEDLKRVNPHLLRGVTPPGHSTYELWVPAEKAAAYSGQQGELASLRELTSINTRQYAAADNPNNHVVEPGDTLSGIASRYRVSVDYLRSVNGLEGDSIVAGTTLRVATKAYHRPEGAKYHRVRRGENLSSIADDYGISVAELKRMNGLRSSRIYAGKRLVVAAAPAAPPVVLGAAPGAQEGDRSLYQVRSGDSLAKIARKFRTTVEALREHNGLDAAGSIYPGQELKVLQPEM